MEDIQEKIKAKIAEMQQYHDTFSRLMHIEDVTNGVKPLVTEAEVLRAGIVSRQEEIVKYELEVLFSQAYPERYSRPEELSKLVEDKERELEDYRQKFSLE